MDSYIDVFLPENGIVTLQLYSQTGQIVKEFKENYQSGSNTLEVGIDSLASGVYNYIILFNNEKETGKLVRLKGATRELKEKKKLAEKDTVDNGKDSR